MTTSTTDAEAIARIIDPDVWHKLLPRDGRAVYWDTRREKARNKANAILSYLASRREAQEPVPPFAENGYGSRLLREAVAYLNEYVFDYDSGADHEPTEFERFMMEDMLNGLFSHEPFFGIIRNLSAPPSPAPAPAGEVERLRWALENTKFAILRADPEILTDTLWMPDDLSRGETVVDHIDAALNGGRAE